MDYISNRSRFLTQPVDVHVGKAEAHAVKGKPSNLVSRKTCLLDQFGRQRIASCWKQERGMLFE